MKRHSNMPHKWYNLEEVFTSCDSLEKIYESLKTILHLQLTNKLSWSPDPSRAILHWSRKINDSHDMSSAFCLVQILTSYATSGARDVNVETILEVFLKCHWMLTTVLLLKNPRFENLRSALTGLYFSLIECHQKTLMSHFCEVGRTFLKSLVTPNMPAQIRTQCVKLLNELLKLSPSMARDVFRKKYNKYFMDLPNLLQVLGDYDAQSSVVEAIYRMSTSFERSKCVTQWFPDLDCTLHSLFIRISEFDPDCRRFLNAFNALHGDNRKVYTLPCLSAIIGKLPLSKPKDPSYQKFWVDFNLGSQTILLLCHKQPDIIRMESSASPPWESLVLDQDDIQKVVLTRTVQVYILEIVMVKVEKVAELFSSPLSLEIKSRLTEVFVFEFAPTVVLEKVCALLFPEKFKIVALEPEGWVNIAARASCTQSGEGIKSSCSNRRYRKCSMNMIHCKASGTSTSEPLNEVCVVVKRDVENASAAHLHPTQCSETSCAQKYKKSSITCASGSVPAMNEDKLTEPKGSGKKHPSKHFTKSSVCSLVLESDVQEITGPGSLDKYEMDTVEPAMALSTPVMNSFINTTSQDVLLLNMAMDSVEDNAGYNEKSNMSDVLQKKAVKTNVITVSEDDVVPCSLNTQEMKNLQTLKCATVFHPKSVISSELPSKFKGDSRNIHHSEHETNKATDTREAITGTQQKRCRRTKVTKKRTSVGEDDTQGVEDTSVHLTSVASSKSEKMLSHNNAELSSVISDSKKKGRKIPRNSSPVEATRVYYLRSRLRSQSADGTAQHSTDLKAKASCKSKKAFTSPKVSSPKYGYERSRRKTLEPNIIAVSPRDTDTVRLRTPRVDTMEPATPRADAMLPVATPRTDTMQPATPRTDTMQPATPRADTMQPATPRADTMQPATSRTDTMQPAIPRCSTMQSAIPRSNTKQSATPRANTMQSATPRADTMQPATPKTYTMQPTTPRSNTMQPTTPRANTMQPATPMAYTMQPTTPRSNTMQPTTPRSDTMQPTTPRSNTMQPTTPRFNTMQRTTPRADTMHPATPLDDIMQPATPRAYTMQPTTPRTDTMHPATPLDDIMQPTTPRSNTMQPTTPRANAMHPATPRADTMQPATPRGDIMHPTTPRSDGLQFATSETCRADALQPSAPNATQDDALQHIGPDIINTYCSASPRIEVAQNVTLKIPLQVASLRSETSSHLTLKAKTMPTSTSNVDTLPVNSRDDDQQPDTSGALKSDTPHPVTDKPSSPINPSCDNPVDNTPRPGTPWPDKHRCHTPRPDTSWHGSHWPDIHRPHTPGLETTGKRDELPTTSLSNVCPDLMSSSLPFTPKSPPTRSRTCRIFSPKDSPIIDKDDLSLCLEESSGIDIQKHDTDNGNPRKELDCQSSFEVDHSKSRELVLSREIQLFETLPATENTKIVEKDNQENTDLSIKDNGLTLHDKIDSSNYSIGVRNRKSPSKALESTLMILADYPVKASYLTPVKVPYCTDISMLGSKSTGDVKKRERKMRRKSNSNLPLYKSSGKSTTFSYGLEERGIKTLRTKKKLFDTTSHSLLEGSPPHTSTPHEVYTFDEKDDASEVSPYSRQNENKVCRRKCQSVTVRNSEKSFFKNKRSSNSSRKIDERNDRSYETDKNDKMPENNTGSRLKNLNKSKTSEKERGKRPSQRNISAGGLFEDPQVVSMKSVIHDVYSDFDSPDQCIENSWFYNQKEGRKFEGSTYSMKRKSLSRLDLFDNRPEGDWKPFKERKKRISKELKGEVLKSHRKATVNKSRRKKQNSQSFAKHFSSTDRHSDIDTDNRSSRREESSDLIIYEEGCKNAQNEALEILRHTSKSSVESNTQNVMEYKLFPSKAKDMDESQKRSRTDLEESFGFSSPELMAHQVKQPHTKRIRKSVEDKGIKSLVENILPQQQKPSSQMRPVVKLSDVPNPPYNTPVSVEIVTDLSTQPFDTRDISVILSNRLNSQNVSSGRLQSTLIEEINHPNIPNERFSYVTELNSSYNSLPVDPSKSEMETQNSSLKDIQENDISPLLNKDISSKLDFDNSSEEGFQEPFEMIPKHSWMSLHEDSEESKEDVSEKKNELTEDHLFHLENQASISTTNKPQISEEASDSQDHLQEKVNSLPMPSLQNCCKSQKNYNDNLDARGGCEENVSGPSSMISVTLNSLLNRLTNKASSEPASKPQHTPNSSRMESTPVYPAPRTLFVTSKETLSEGQEKTAPTAQNSYCDSLQNIQTCIEHIADGLYRLASALKSHQTHHR